MSEQSQEEASKAVMPRPKALPVTPENIPTELKSIRAWVMWSYKLKKDGKWTKPPYKVDGSNAKSTDPKTWTTFTEALKQYERGGFDGIGVALHNELGIGGLDLDHCRNGETIEPWALQIIEEVKGYTEVSPSGTGIRILVKASLPPGRRKKGNIEMYDTGRYLTMTGCHIPSTPKTIEPRKEAIEALHNRVFGKPKTEQSNPNRQNGTRLHLEDDVLLKKAFSAKNGDKIKRLYDGDFSGYPSQSEADLALCSCLAFWTQDPIQLDRLFRASKLYREKWDEKHYGDGSTIGEVAISTVLAGSGEHYGEGNGETEEKKSQADKLIELAEKAGAEYFHTPLGESFISFPVGEHQENWPVLSTATRNWLRSLYYAATHKAPNNEALRSVVGVLESIAKFDGQEEEVHLRTAWHGGNLYYDLSDPAWRCVEITKDSWRVMDKAPVRFRRYSHMAAQVEPEHGGSIEKLWDFVNVKGEQDQRLLTSSLVTSLIPDIPRPPLIIHGDQGSGKTFLALILAGLIDPSGAALLKAKDESDMVQGLAHHYCAVLDNLSSIPEWKSDLLSRAVTGEGFTKRQLYTDEDDVIFSYRRFLIITGIGLVVSKPDLLDRSIIIGIEGVAGNMRRQERTLWQRFRTERPRLFGAILDLLSGAMANYDSISLPTLPRMADFATWACAMTKGCGENVEEFQKAFKANIGRQNEEAITASTMATVLLAMLEGSDAWNGTASELLTDLKSKGEEMKVLKELPSTAAVLGRQLREVRPNLQALGWLVDFPRNGKARPISIIREGDKRQEHGGGPGNGKGPENAVIAVTPSLTEENQVVIDDGNCDSKKTAVIAVTTAVTPKPLTSKGNDSNDSNDSKLPLLAGSDWEKV